MHTFKNVHWIRDARENLKMDFYLKAFWNYESGKTSLKSL